MEHFRSGISMKKHAKGGYSHNSEHFTGKKKGKKARRKGKGLTKKQRRKKRGTHANKYKERRLN